MKPVISTAQIARGQVGVHRVVSELIKRGHHPYLPVIDVGIDILLGSGVRLQVKTTQRQSGHWRQKDRWSFSLQRAQRIVKRQYVSCSARKYSEVVDFVVLHAVEASRFWVVPAFVLDGRYTVTFRDGRTQWQDCDADEAKRLRATGMSFQEIADQLGVSHHTAMRRVKGIGSRNNRNYALIPQYENRWELIAGHEATIRQVNAVDDSRLVEKPAVGLKVPT